MSNYVLSPKARQEIREIWDFIAQDDLDAADRWTMKLIEVFRLLARNPRIGHTRKDLTNFAGTLLAHRKVPRCLSTAR